MSENSPDRRGQTHEGELGSCLLENAESQTGARSERALETALGNSSSPCLAMVSLPKVQLPSVNHDLKY